MPIDPTVAIGADLGEESLTWEPTDVMLYHLGIGAGSEPFSARELGYTYEKNLKVLLGFATVATTLHMSDPPTVSFPGIDIELAKAVHGSQSITVHRALPTSGKAVARSRIANVYDKGKAAVIVQETEVSDTDGNPLWTNVSRIFARGEGGFGGERGPSETVEFPDREPDHIVESKTLPQQALLYRLLGDRNPLHADPEFAKNAGFDQPILHGLCTYGMVAKAVTDTVADGDPDRVRSWTARFAGIVIPGETLRVRIWHEDDRYLVATDTLERGTPVLADAVFTTW